MGLLSKVRRVSDNPKFADAYKDATVPESLDDPQARPSAEQVREWKAAELRARDEAEEMRRRGAVAVMKLSKEVAEEVRPEIAKVVQRHADAIVALGKVTAELKELFEDLHDKGYSMLAYLRNPRLRDFEPDDVERYLKEVREYWPEVEIKE